MVGLLGVMSSAEDKSVAVAVGLPPAAAERPPTAGRRAQTTTEDTAAKETTASPTTVDAESQVSFLNKNNSDIAILLSLLQLDAAGLEKLSTSSGLDENISASLKTLAASKTAKSNAEATSSADVASDGESSHVQEEVPVGGSGKVSIKYNHYAKELEIENGVLKGIDFFSLAWANGKGTVLHLSAVEQKPDQGEVAYLIEENGEIDPNIEYSTGITYKGLAPGNTYWVHVIMGKEEKQKLDEERKVRAEERLKQEAEAKEKGGIATGYNFGGEDSASCSCLEGNPCASEYNCKNWKNRFEIAKENGWKGF